MAQAPVALPPLQEAVTRAVPEAPAATVALKVAWFSPMGIGTDLGRSVKKAGWLQEIASATPSCVVPLMVTVMLTVEPGVTIPGVMIVVRGIKFSDTKAFYTKVAGLWRVFLEISRT